MNKFHLHLVSDSTGETVSSVARAAVAQFDDLDPEEHVWSLVRTSRQLDKVISGIEAYPGVVIYTLINKELREQLRRYCHEKNLPCIPVLARVMTEMSAYLGLKPSSNPGRQHELNEEYFSRVEAINFTLAHDDGQATWDLEEADVVIVGVSRTSKSPTCVYLAHRGYKAANVPFVKADLLPDNLPLLKRPLVVGLTIDYERLLQIRRSRMQSIQQEAETSYTDIEAVQGEILEAKRYFGKHRWPIIDVTRRSVEETAAQIINLYQQHYEKRMSRGSANG